jgi:hypothetical protein
MPTDKPVALFLALAASPASRPLFHRLRHDEEAFLPHMDKFYLTQIGTTSPPALPPEQICRPQRGSIIVIVVLGDLVVVDASCHHAFHQKDHHHS